MSARTPRVPICSLARNKGTTKMISSSRISIRNDSLLALVDIPEDRRCRTIEHAAQRFPPGGGNEILPERDIEHLIIGLLLRLGGELLLILRRLRARESIAQLFDLRILRPAEPAAILAAPADRGVDDRIENIGA